ncbi:hypothetical protein pdam_00016554 [Pocillopora damicornis]|uniref:Uncharacterized protein n=1 Tax=Pocillopora damicornis TaxID=46731 RepID=A0A3M6TG70_POCDA|nr:hypothetical protein pdam_00016554 [Pocillopora damicornis]
MAERRLHDRGQNQDDNAVPAAIRNSNMDLFYNSMGLCGNFTEKLRQLQERSNKSNLEALQRIENRLETGENGAKTRRRQNRQKRRTIVVPPACRCPWTKDIIEAALQRYFKMCLETHKLKSSNRYEAHKQKTRKSGRQREKLMRQTKPWSWSTGLTSMKRGEWQRFL